MRTAFLIGLMIAAGLASSAQAQFGTFPKPKADRDPYDLPKAYNENPYGRDYSTNRDSNAYTNTSRDKRDDGYSPGGYSAGGSASRNSSSGGYSGYSRPAPPPTYGSGANRQNPNCSKPGVVC